MKCLSPHMYAVFCAYELIKLFFLAVTAAYPFSNLLYTYSALSALSLPALLWFMLLLNENYFKGLLHAAVLCKFLAVCAELLYIFHKGFSILAGQQGLIQSHTVFLKEILFFITVDIILLCYSYTRGRTYYADNSSS